MSWKENGIFPIPNDWWALAITTHICQLLGLSYQNFFDSLRALFDNNCPMGSFNSDAYHERLLRIKHKFESADGEGDYIFPIVLWPSLTTLANYSF